MIYSQIYIFKNCCILPKIRNAITVPSLFVSTVIKQNDKIHFAYNFCVQIIIHLSTEKILNGFMVLTMCQHLSLPPPPPPTPPSFSLYCSETFSMFRLETAISHPAQLLVIETSLPYISGLPLMRPCLWEGRIYESPNY